MKNLITLILLSISLTSCLAREIDFFDNNKGQVELFEQKTVTEKTCITARKQKTEEVKDQHTEIKK